MAQCNQTYIASVPYIGECPCISTTTKQKKNLASITTKPPLMSGDELWTYKHGSILAQASSSTGAKPCAGLGDDGHPPTMNCAAEDPWNDKVEAATPETGRKHGRHSSVAGHAETVRGASPGRGPPDRGYSAGSFIGEARRWCATCRYKACAHAGIAMFLRWAEATKSLPTCTSKGHIQ